MFSFFLFTFYVFYLSVLCNVLGRWLMEMLEGPFVLFTNENVWCSSSTNYDELCFPGFLGMFYIISLNFPCISTLLILFLLTSCWILNAFPVSIELNVWPFIFSLTNVVNCLIDFLIVYQPYIPRITHDLLWNSVFFLLSHDCVVNH